MQGITPGAAALHQENPSAAGDAGCSGPAGKAAWAPTPKGQIQGVKASVCVSRFLLALLSTWTVFSDRSQMTSTSFSSKSCLCSLIFMCSFSVKKSMISARSLLFACRFLKAVCRSLYSFGLNLAKLCICRSSRRLSLDEMQLTRVVKEAKTGLKSGYGREVVR